MKYAIAEKFFSVQGEGTYAGTPMAFIRFVGCSVGKKICQHCDTDFDRTYEWLGGGEFTPKELAEWAQDLHADHVCFTGGEPFDQPIEFFQEFKGSCYWVDKFHYETSGTKLIPFVPGYNDHIVCCPKPGFLPEVIDKANEIKVIVGGLGLGPGWPTLHDALGWAEVDRPVFLQPRNKKNEVDFQQLAIAEELVRQNPTLRLSVQLHKLLRVR